LVKIAAMKNEVERNANAAGFEPIEDAKLLRVRFCSRDFFSDAFRGSLKAQLKMVETRNEKGIESRFVERQAGGDETDIESCGSRCANEFDNVRTREWFAAGEVRLQHTEFGSLAENGGPSFGVEFGISRGQFARIGAVHTMQRAAVRQFANKGERIVL
jgi:hypothetical protein